jgi:predicted anti-sigma-YlaC factor YlaD
MKCEEVQILIEDYVDSALDQKAAALVKAHMTGCNACSSFHLEVTREQELYARYERDVEQFFRHSPAVVRDGEGS